MFVEDFVGTKVTTKGNNTFVEGNNFAFFQSNDTMIVVKASLECGAKKVYLDSNSWDYSTTTGKYRNIFLNEKKAETLKKINSGEYTLVDLN
jgi:hypothetical protein